MAHVILLSLVAITIAYSYKLSLLAFVIAVICNYLLVLPLYYIWREVIKDVKCNIVPRK